MAVFPIDTVSGTSFLPQPSTFCQEFPTGCRMGARIPYTLSKSHKPRCGASVRRMLGEKSQKICRNSLHFFKCSPTQMWRGFEADDGQKFIKRVSKFFTLFGFRISLRSPEPASNLTFLSWHVFCPLAILSFLFYKFYPPLNSR